MCTNFRATEPRTLSFAVASPPQFLFATTEEALGRQFLDCVKGSDCILFDAVPAAELFVDESHTVEF